MTLKLLDGVKVVDFTTYVAGPAASRILADMGADVIKVEGKGGEPWRTFGASVGTPILEEENPMFTMENANKRGMAINLKNEKGLELMYKLIEEADVFVSNVRKESLEKLGLGYEELSKRFPKLVYGHISGYGIKGEESGRPGFDIVAYWARGGMLVDMPAKGDNPMTAPTGAGDHVTSLALLSGICAALYRAQKTGEGELVKAALFHSAIFVNGMMITSTQYDDIYPKSKYDPSHPLMNTYRCKDGEAITLALLQYGKQYPRLCEVLEISEFMEDVRYNSISEVQKENHNEEFCRILEEAFLRFDSEYLIEELNKRDLTFEKALHFHEVAQDKQALVNDFLVEYEFENGSKFNMPTAPILTSQEETITFKRAPKLGEHNREVMLELGYTEEEIEELINDGNILYN